VSTSRRRNLRLRKSDNIGFMAKEKRAYPANRVDALRWPVYCVDMITRHQ
jgi:hypothetical protein